MAVHSNFHLADGQVHLWIGVSDLMLAGSARNACERLLTTKELSHCRGFHQPAYRDEYLLSKALLRHTLSHYGDRGGRDWSIVKDDYGKPSLSDEQTFESGALNFNIAQAGGLAVCAVTRGKQLGVDVETVSGDDRLLEDAEHYLAPDELKALIALPPAQRRHQFSRYWTLKESYIKARGQGLSDCPLHSFGFDLTGPRPQLMAEDTSQQWTFECLEPSPDFVIALALAGREQPDISLFEANVLAGPRPLQSITDVFVQQSSPQLQVI